MKFINAQELLCFGLLVYVYELVETLKKLLRCFFRS